MDPELNVSFQVPKLENAHILLNFIIVNHHQTCLPLLHICLAHG